MVRGLSSLWNPEEEPGATLPQKGRPKECDHISEGLAGLGGNPREGRRQEFPTVEAQKDRLLYEVISFLSSLVNNQGLVLLAGRVLALRHWTDGHSSVWSMQMEIDWMEGNTRE